MRHEWFTAWSDQHLGVTIMLARAAQLSDKEVFAAFDADPTTVQALSLDQVDDDPGSSRVRIGRRDGWLYAVEHFTSIGAGDVVLEQLSRGGAEAFALRCAQADVSHQGAVDGRVTTRFDLGLPQFRSGTDPDRYLDEMTGVGLMTADGPPLAARGAHLLETITGVELSAGMLEAPLASAVLRRTW